MKEVHSGTNCSSPPPVCLILEIPSLFNHQLVTDLKQLLHNTWSVVPGLGKLAEMQWLLPVWAPLRGDFLPAGPKSSSILPTPEVAPQRASRRLSSPVSSAPAGRRNGR